MSIDLPILRIIQGTRPNPSADCYRRLEKLTGARMLPPIEQVIETAMKAEQDKTRHLHSSSASFSAKPARRKRKPTLASAIKQATKAGLTVTAVTVKAGEVTLQVGEPDAKAAGDLDAWLAKRGTRARQA